MTNIKTIFNEKSGSPLAKIEMDIENVALMTRGATVQVNDTAEGTNPQAIIDGIRSHLNRDGDLVYWEAGPSFDGKIIIKFNGKKKINRIAIFAYPQNTRVEDKGATPIEEFIIEYATDSDLTNWVAWSGLEDRSDEVGMVATSISNGYVSGNQNTYNVFQDKTGVEAYGIRLNIITAGTVRICEIEVWRTLEFRNFSRISINQERDVLSGIFKTGVGSGTLIDGASEYYPGRGYFQDLARKDIPNLPMRVYGGFSKRGLEVWDIIGHYYLAEWTCYMGSKKVEFKVKDRIKSLKEKSVILGAEILKGKTREWIIEWMGLKAGLHSDEMSLFQSSDIVQMFYPIGARIWDEMNEIAKGLADIDLYIDRKNRLIWNVYLESVPHEWIVAGEAEFFKCTLDNLIIEGDKIKVSQQIIANYDPNHEITYRQKWEVWIVNEKIERYGIFDGTRLKIYSGKNDQEIVDWPWTIQDGEQLEDGIYGDPLTSGWSYRANNNLGFKVDDEGDWWMARVIFEESSGKYFIELSSFDVEEKVQKAIRIDMNTTCLLYTSPSPRDRG